MKTPIAFAVCAALTAGAAPSGDAAPRTQAPAPKPAARAWNPPGCPPPAQTGGGPSNVTITGPCGLKYTAAAECDAEGDDFLVTSVIPGKDSTELVLFINVERFVGPRTYQPPNDMYLSLKVGKKIYRWSTNEYTATVGAGSKSVSFKNVKLEAEPVLIGCTGPQMNYQCDGRDSEPQHEASVSMASGTIQCKTGGAKKP